MIVDEGSIPTTVDRYTLLTPVTLDGGWTPGSTAIVVVDSSRTVPVVWLGPKPPKAGDLAVAHAVGGRWVADRSGDSSTVTCGVGCEIPKVDLTLTLTNTLLGTHSVPLAFDGVDSWATACVNQSIFQLACVGGTMTFYSTNFVGGPCPTGSPITCVSSGPSPLGLTVLTLSCSPLLLEYGTTNCPSLTGQGYTKLTVTL